LSVSEEHAVQPSATTVTLQPPADPAPLGLAAFALTTFLLSAKNANWMTHSTGSAWLSYAFAYGGLAQLLAGMWEFRNRNVFGAVAFSTYGAFWIGLGLCVRIIVLPAVAAARTPAALVVANAALNKDLAWILLAFFIVNTYLLILSTQINLAVFGVFLTLGVTEIILCIGNFTLAGTATTSGVIQVGGYVGLVTALVAWYTSMAGIANGMSGRIKLPEGEPLLK